MNGVSQSPSAVRYYKIEKPQARKILYIFAPILIMSFRDVRGIMAMFVTQAKEEFDSMDHKLVRIAGGIVSFVIAGLVWMLFFRGFSPI